MSEAEPETGPDTDVDVPRILTNTTEIAGDDAEPYVAGVMWKLEVQDRGLDSNVISLEPGGGIAMHAGAEVDVLVHVLAGGGRLVTEQGDIDLTPGALLWLPRRSRRQFDAGPNGLRYLTVHQKRQILGLTPTVRQVG